MLNGVVCTPPLVDMERDSEFCCDSSVVAVSLPNCSLAFRPNRAVLPRMSDEPVVRLTLPASMLLTISSSLPSYWSLMFFESKSNVASVL